jgi:hypothetical protein
VDVNMPNRFQDLIPEENFSNRFQDLIPESTATPTAQGANRFADLIPTPGQVKEQPAPEGSIIRKVRDLPFVKKHRIEMFGPPLPGMENLSEEMLKGVERIDAQVEKAIQKFEPDITPESVAKQSLPEFLAKDYSRQVIADFARFYKPSNYMMFKGVTGVATPVIKKAVAPAAKKVWSKIPDSVKKVLLRNLTVGKGQPQAYQQLAEKAGLARMAGAEEAMVAGKVLTTKPFTGKPLGMKEQRIVGRIFRGQAEKIRHLPKYSEYSAIATEGRAIMDKWSKELVKSGVPSAEAAKTINENVGSYMARLFESKSGQRALGFSSKPARLRLDGLKHRKNLSSDVLKLLGEVKAPAYPTALRVKELSTTVANANLFNRVSANPEWASLYPQAGWVKMPSTASMGGLRNKWVMPEIAEDINGLVQAPSQMMKTYMKYLSAWKYGKVVLNPATHSRNIMSNSMLLDFSGVNHMRQAMLYPKVIGDYVRKGQMYQLAKKHGAIGDEFVGGEVKAMGDLYARSPGTHMDKVMSAIKYPFKKAGQVYQAEEQLSKMVKFTDMMSKGATPEVAAREAQKWLFNYNKIPKIIDLTRKFGSPFITFTYKAIPRIAETMVNNPMKIYKYYAAFNAFNNASAKSLGMTPKQIEEENKFLPDYMKMPIPGIPSNLLMPVRDKYGRTQHLNLEYILPIGMAPEIAERGILGGGFSNPFVNIIGEIKANRDFLGREIVGEGFSPLQKNIKFAEHAYRQLAPSFAPNVGPFKGGYSWEKLRDSLAKRGDYIGRVREPEQVLFDVLVGLKVTPINIQEQKMFQSFNKESDVNAILREMKKVERHQGISEEEKERKRSEVMERIGRVINK